MPRCCGVRSRSSKSCATPPARPSGVSIFNKRIGAGHDAAVAGRSGHAAAAPRSARPAVRAGRSAGGGVDDRRRRRPRAVRHARGRAGGARTRTTLFYGARRADELYCIDLFEALGVTIVLATEDGSRGVRGRITVPLEAALEGASARQSREALRLRPDADDARLRGARAARTAAPATSRSSR